MLFLIPIPPSCPSNRLDLPGQPPDDTSSLARPPIAGRRRARRLL